MRPSAGSIPDIWNANVNIDGGLSESDHCSETYQSVEQIEQGAYCAKDEESVDAYLGVSIISRGRHYGLGVVITRGIRGMRWRLLERILRWR